MWVRIGPVRASAARAWLATARRNLQRVREDPAVQAVVGLPPAVLASFEAFLAAWTASAGADDFDWAAEVDPAEVRPLAAWWFGFGQIVRERGAELGLSAPPLDAQPFYDALVAAMANVLASEESPDPDHFAAKFAEVAPAFDAPVDGRKRGSPIRVLVVDDTEDIRLLLRFALDHDTRFTVVGEAGSGEEAIEHVSRGCPDVVLLDCMLPGMTGLDTLPLIRERCPHTKVVMTSASDEFRDPAERWGVPFLPKTATMAEIAATLQAVAA